jgi:hydrogenase/urease accessory protein HupE
MDSLVKVLRYKKEALVIFLVLGVRFGMPLPRNMSYTCGFFLSTKIIHDLGGEFVGYHLHCR